MQRVECNEQVLILYIAIMEENKIIEKLDHPESKVKVLYRLTKKGIDLLPLMIEINLWLKNIFLYRQTEKQC